MVVLDESEQILKHFLGGTMENRDPHDMFLLFQEVIRSAEVVIAQDADLGWITYNTLGKLKKPITFNVNEYKQTQEIELFQFETQMTADLMHNLADGARIFVAANRKSTIEALAALVTHHLPETEADHASPPTPSKIPRYCSSRLRPRRKHSIMT